MSIHINVKTFISGHNNGKTLAKAVLNGKTVYEGITLETYTFNTLYFYERLLAKSDYGFEGYLYRDRGAFGVPNGDKDMGHVGKLSLGASHFGYRRTIAIYTKPDIVASKIKKVTLKTATYMSEPIMVYGGMANYSWTSGSEGYNLSAESIGTLSADTEYDITEVYRRMIESSAKHIYLKFIHVKNEKDNTNGSTWTASFYMPTIIVEHR